MVAVMVIMFLALLRVQPLTRLCSLAVCLMAMPYLFYGVAFGRTVLNLREAAMYAHGAALAIPIIRAVARRRVSLSASEKVLLALLLVTFMTSTYLPIAYQLSRGTLGEQFLSRLRFGFVHSMLLVVGAASAMIFIRTRADAERLVRWMLIAAVVISADGLFGYIFGFWRDIAGAQSGQPDRLGALTGGGFDSAGRCLAIGVACSLGIALSRHKFFITGMLFAIVATAVSIFTVTRGVYIGVAMAWVLAWAYRSRGVAGWVVSVAILALVSLIPVTAYSTVQGYFDETRGTGIVDAASLNDRMNFWSSFTVPVLQDNPLGTGYGLGQETVWAGDYSKSFWGETVRQDSNITLHSFDVILLIENGAGGAAIIVLLLVFLIGAPFAIFRRRRQDLAQAAWTIWTAAAILFVTLSIIAFYYLELLLLILVGAVLAMRRLLRQSVPVASDWAMPARRGQFVVPGRAAAASASRLNPVRAFQGLIER
jgi:hypothetical protein